VKSKAPNGRTFHFQITAAGLGKLGGDSEAQLFKKIPTLEHLQDMLRADDNTVVVTIRGIGDMTPRNPDSFVDLSASETDFDRPKAVVHLGNAKAGPTQFLGSSETPNDRATWAAMDAVADKIALIFAGNEPFDILAGPNRVIPVPADPGFRSLFDGTAASFKHWRLAGPTGGGMLDINGEMVSYREGALRLFYHATEAFTDFTLRLQFRILDVNAHNSGVFVRFPRPTLDLVTDELKKRAGLEAAFDTEKPRLALEFQRACCAELHARPHADDVEAAGLGGESELDIVGSEHQCGAPRFAPRQGRGKVESVERPQWSRKRVGGPAQHLRRDRYQLDRLEQLQHRPPPRGQLGIPESAAQPQAIECAQALDFSEGAGHSLFDRVPLCETARFTQGCPQENRGVQIGDHRPPWRSSRSAARLSIAPPGARGIATSRRRRVGGRPGRAAGPWSHGRTRAMGMSRLSTVSVSPRRTRRR
jgi:hypothetical protein